MRPTEIAYFVGWTIMAIGLPVVFISNTAAIILWLTGSLIIWASLKATGRRLMYEIQQIRRDLEPHDRGLDARIYRWPPGGPHA